MAIESEINAEILKFSKDLYPWQREALRRLLKKGDLTTADKKEIFERACTDHKIRTAVSTPPDTTLLEHELPSKVAASRLSLVGLRGLENVNALRTGPRLALGKGMTVVFGENASGKSGYARVMKKACTARAVEPVLPNVYADLPPKEPARAVFEIDDAGIVKEEKWEDGKPSPVSLRRFAVFDAKCGRAYISESNKLTFLPWAFDVLDKLASLTKEIKEQFAAQARSTEPKGDALSPLIDDTSIGKLLALISADTKAELIQSRAKWDAPDDEVLKAKEQELFRLKAGSPAAIRLSLAAERKRIEAFQARLQAIEGVLSEQKLKDVKTKVSDYEKYDQAVKAAAAMAFGGAELKGIGGEVWRELILAAARYSTQVAYPGEPFPATVHGALCVLCLQPLSDAAQVRLRRFWDFLHDETSKRRDAAKRDLDERVLVIGNLVRTIPQEAHTFEDSLATSQPDLWMSGKAFLDSAADRAKGIEQAIASGKWEDVKGMPASVIPKCVAGIEPIDKELSKVKDDAQASKQLQSLSSEVEELKARKRLSKNLGAVLGHLDSLKAGRRLSVAAGAISTLSITNKTKDLQKQYVTDAFKKSFQAEIKSSGLRRARAGIAEHSEKGKVLHEVTLDGATTAAGPQDVLSEGERTAISLAYFLADLGSVEETCGIILDDPLTSLDHSIRENVINRLVSEARRRQVVVFTHDLAVYSEIQKAAKVSQVEFQGQQVEALGQYVGIVSNDEPWDVLDVGERVQRLDELVKDAVAAEGRGDTKAFREIVGAFYDRLRSTWERSVEELVFNKVVQRYERGVKTLALTGVAVDSETVTSIFEGMTRASEMTEAHDHAVGAHKPLSTCDDMRADLKALKDFAQQQRSKKNDAEKRHKHLKN